MKNNLLAEHCPATKIKEYLLELVDIQVEHILNGEVVPKNICLLVSLSYQRKVLTI